MSGDTHDIIPETVSEALEMWDAGKTVFSVEMGGLGPGYEQAIQILAFEIMRVWNGKVIDESTISDRRAELDEVVRRLDKRFGFSGAQVGAAQNLAACVVRRGYRAALRDELVKDRLIQVSNQPLPSLQPQ